MMSLFRRIVGKIWAVYGFIVFFLIVIIFFPFYFVFLGLLPKRYSWYVIWFNHHIFPYIFFSLIGMWIKVKGKELITKNKPYIIVSNHRTAIDFVANPTAFPGVYKFLAKKELTKVPFLGFVVRHICIMVDRKNSNSAARSMEELKHAFNEGYSVFIYPEGTRNRGDDPLGTFYTGAFRLAFELQTPLAIMTLQNVHKRSAKAELFDLWPGKLSIKWSGVLDPAHFETYQEMIEQTRALMIADLNNH